MEFDLESYRANADLTSPFRGQTYYGGPHTAAGAARANAVCLGLQGEVGRLTAFFEKCVCRGDLISAERLQAHLGDLLWHISEALTALGISVSDEQPSFDESQETITGAVKEMGVIERVRLTPGVFDKNAMEVLQVVSCLASYAASLSTFIYACLIEKNMHPPRMAVGQLSTVLSSWHRMVQMFGLEAEQVALTDLGKRKKTSPNKE